MQMFSDILENAIKSLKPQVFKAVSHETLHFVTYNGERIYLETTDNQGRMQSAKKTALGIWIKELEGELTLNARLARRIVGGVGVYQSESHLNKYSSIAQRLKKLDICDHSKITDSIIKILEQCDDELLPFRLEEILDLVEACKNS